MRRQLVCNDEAVDAEKQHTVPCSDCPFARTALNGWLGAMSKEEWIKLAHSDVLEPCHMIRNQQCAGLAIYRANILKRPRDPEILVLPKDKEKVFATPMEFLDHHSKSPFKKA